MMILSCYRALVGYVVPRCCGLVIKSRTIRSQQSAQKCSSELFANDICIALHRYLWLICLVETANYLKELIQLESPLWNAYLHFLPKP